MSIQQARAHLDEAIQQLGISVEKVSLDGGSLGDHMDCIAIELERMDRALGGNTLLSHAAEIVRAAFVELLAAREALS